MEGEGRYWISTNQHSSSGDRLPRPLWMDSWRPWCWWEMRVFFKRSKHGHRHVHNRPKGNPMPLSLLTTNIPIHSEIKRIGGSKILTLEKPQFQSRRHRIFDPPLSKKTKCLWYMTISNFLKFSRSMVALRLCQAFTNLKCASWNCGQKWILELVRYTADGPTPPRAVLFSPCDPWVWEKQRAPGAVAE